MDGRPDGELYKQVMIRSFKIYLFRRALNFVEVEEEKHIDLFEIKIYDETDDEPFDNFSCSQNWRGLRKRKDVRGSSLFIDFFSISHLPRIQTSTENSPSCRRTHY